MRACPSLLALALCLAWIAPGGRAFAEGDSRVQFHVQFENQPCGTSHAFVVEGQVNLPEGAVLRAEVFYQKQTKASPREERETGKTTVMEEVSLDDAKLTVSAGRFSATLGMTATPHYSGEYALSLLLAAEDQPDSVRRWLADVGEVPEFRVSKTVGDVQQLDAQRRAVSDSVRNDMIGIRRLADEARARFLPLLQQPEPTGNAFRDSLRPDWEDRLGQIVNRNEFRCEKDLYWIEYYGRRYIALLVSDLRAVVGRYCEVLDLPATERPAMEKVAEMEQNFTDTWLMWMEYLQFPLPKDTTAARQCIEEVREQIRGFAAWFDAASATPPADAAGAAAARSKVLQWQAQLLAGIARLTQSLPDFEFAPLTEFTRNITRTMRDAGLAVGAGDAAARDRVQQSLGVQVTTLQALEQALKDQ